jgi:uncharacterized protein (TIGR03663 family)
LLRLYALELKPLHHDEGVNGFFLMNLLRQGRYAYDPANYHGPTLYYLTLPFVVLTGLGTFVVRLVPALFGVGTVWLVLGLRRRVGAVAALAAAALLAVSPACVFYSRYFIHEMPFVFFTLALVVSALRFWEAEANPDARRSTGIYAASAALVLLVLSFNLTWVPNSPDGSIVLLPRILLALILLGWAAVLAALVNYGGRKAEYLLLASASAAMMFATKETAFISVGTLGLAALVASAWVALSGGRGRSVRRGSPSFIKSGQGVVLLVGALALFAFIWVAFYSSFFSNWKGVADSFKAFAVWQKTGMSEFHGKPAHTYVKWLLEQDAAVLVLGGMGALVALFERRRNRFAVFAAAWGFGLMAAYSIISYKTPWLVLNFIVPLAVAGGYAVQAAGGWAARRWRQLRPRGWVWPGAAALLSVAVGVGLYQTYVVNFVKYDDDSYPYVYSQTRREFLDLVAEIEMVGRRAGTKEPGFATASTDYWPLPWYFRDNSHAGYEGRLSSYYDPKSTLAVIGREDQLPQLQRMLGDSYERVGALYPLRPGVNLVLYARRDLVLR